MKETTEHPRGVGPKTRVVAYFDSVLGIDLFRVDYWFEGLGEGYEWMTPQHRAGLGPQWRPMHVLKDANEAVEIAKRVMVYGTDRAERVLVEFIP